MTKHTQPWKKKEIEGLKQLVSKYPVIAIADVERFPAALFQEIRKKLKGKAEIKVSKTRIIQKALEEAKVKPEFVKLVQKSVAVIFTEMNPFELFAFLKKNKGSAPAKAGTVAPEDIIVPAGDTGLPPGPALSDLKAVGLPTRMEGPTISIAKDTVVAKQGETVSEAAAAALAKLDLKPLKVGLNILAVVEKGEVFMAEVIDIDTETVFQQFVDAHAQAFNLAVNAGYSTEETIVVLVQKAFNESKVVALEANILNKETVEALLARANAQAASLKGLVKEEAPAEEKKPAKKAKEEAKGKKKEEAKEEPPTEEKPAEEKKEEAKEKKEEKKEEPAEEKKEKAKEGGEKSAEEAKEEPKAEKKKEKKKEEKPREKKEAPHKEKEAPKEAATPEEKPKGEK